MTSSNNNSTNNDNGVAPPDKRLYPILEQYAAGDLSAADAAYDIQQLKIPGYEGPSASEVIIWSRMAGFGIPAPTAEEAKAEADRALRKGKT
ncbi:MAG: hypothetical protein PW788_15985 [Micavibrio sp.]|nr:hypothetical protein [Micavibrio sp.]